MSQQNSTGFWVFDLTFVHDCLQFENCIYKKTTEATKLSWSKVYAKKIENSFYLFPKIILALE